MWMVYQMIYCGSRYIYIHTYISKHNRTTSNEEQ